MKKILITGGAGFIGSHIVDIFLEKKYKVLVLDDLSSGNLNNLKSAFKNKNFKFIDGSILNTKLLKKSIKFCEGVIHCATKNVRFSISKPIKCHETNSTGTINVLESAKKNRIKKFIYISSSEVYGNNQLNKKVGEYDFCNPSTIYGASKLTGEYYTLVYKNLYNLNSIILRPFNCYGERSHETGNKAEVIPRFTISLLNNKRPFIYGKGNNTRDFTYVKDVTKIISKVYLQAKFKKDIINIGYGNKVSVIKILKKLNKILGKNIKPKFAPSRPGDVFSLHCNNNLLKKEYKIKPATHIDKGLKIYLNYLKNKSLRVLIKKKNW